MLIRTRLNLTALLLWIAIRIAPKEVRFVGQLIQRFMEDMPEQMTTHDGGLIMLPWSTTKHGWAMSNAQLRECTVVTKRIRKEFDELKQLQEDL